MPTIAVRWHTDSELWGATVNPWDRTRTPGASSGGEAVALATGMSPLGLGSDAAVRFAGPPNAAASATLKPTLGRIPHASELEPAVPIGTQLTVVVGPLARCVADLRAAFEVMAGELRDPWTVPAPLRPGPTFRCERRWCSIRWPGAAPQVRDGVRAARAGGTPATESTRSSRPA